MTPPQPHLDHPTATLRSARDIASVVPYLLGFVPRCSVVVMSVRGRSRRCGLVARVDLPGDPHEVDVFADDLCAFVLRDEPREALVLIYDDLPHDAGRPRWAQLLARIERRLGESGVEVTHALHVQGTRVCSYRCPPGCGCPESDLHLAALPATAAAAAMVLQGRAPAPDRAALDDELLHDPAEAHEVSCTARRDRDLLAGSDAPVAASWRAARAQLFVQAVHSRRRALTAERPTGLRLDPAVAGRLLAGLADVQVRDEIVLAWPGCLDEAREDAPQDGGGAGAVRMPDQDPALIDVLRALVRVAEGHWAAAPLTLLALHCWSVGEGARANVAAARALTADRDYRLARLVDQLLRTGTPPPGARVKH